MYVEFLYFEDCPSHDVALERLRQVMAEQAIDADVHIIRVETEAEAEQYRFTGSPTIRVNGEDIAPLFDTTYGLACRAYRLEDGRISPLPSVQMIRQALKQEAKQ
ncbi:MAG: hypothetical protein OHK0046_05320 [Anaerolineae bacterium]